MMILSERDMRRLEAAIRKAERITQMNRHARQPIHAGSGSSQPYPTGQKNITQQTTYLTRDDRDTLLYYNGTDIVGHIDIWLPSAAESLVVGDTYWIVAKPVYGEVMLRPGRDQAILCQGNLYRRYDDGEDLVYGYYFDHLGEQINPYHKMTVYFEDTASAGESLTWIVVTYTGQSRQAVTGYIDMNGNGAYDAGEPLTYSTVTLWTVWRISGSILYMTEAEYSPIPF